MYIDQQFISDIDFYARISEIFSEIIGSIKYYPYPTIVYKIAINKYINSENAPIPVQEKSKPVISKKEIPEAKIEEKKEEIINKEEPHQENQKDSEIQHLPAGRQGSTSNIQNSTDGNALLK
jgi:hypothetical protein